jgi:protease-4
MEPEDKEFTKMSNKNGWEKKLVEDLAYASIKEKRRSRRWSIFFKLLFFIYLFVLLGVYFYPLDKASLEKVAGSNEHTALIEVKGVIAADAEASADNIITALRNAFKDKKTKGIILRMNTPGGSPVQSGYINDEIYRLKELHPDTKIYAVISDVCASGGYYIAAASDEIYADKGSMVGSIGVLMDGFGFDGAIKKLGITRRLYTAGEHKGFLDPFSAPKEGDVAHVKSMLANIHEQFINTVKKGRGDKLVDDPLLFSGYIWTGEQAIKFGLVDKLGSSSYVARKVIGAEDIKDFTVTETFLDRFAKQMGASMATRLAELGGFSPAPQLR